MKALSIPSWDHQDAGLILVETTYITQHPSPPFIPAVKAVAEVKGLDFSGHTGKRALTTEECVL